MTDLSSYELRVLRWYAGYPEKLDGGAAFMQALEVLRTRGLLNKAGISISIKGREFLKTRALAEPINSKENEHAQEESGNE